MTHETISSAIFTANFPTLVPPNFCTSHLAAGSIEFWWRLGGVDGDDTEDVDAPEDREFGVDGGEPSDMVACWDTENGGRPVTEI